MAVRTNDQAVKDILTMGGDYDETRAPSLMPAIEAAAVMVETLEACAADKDITVSENTLEILERWLAAHFYKVSDRQLSSSSTLSSSGSFDGQTAMGLDFTSYGQQAKLLDPTGCLVDQELATQVDPNIGPRIARGIWLGKRPSEALPYRDRD
jgi:hypothetical protein